ncbi:DUF2889 domain-containing protein [Brevundimonas sp. NIBR10]|uniref:DUF2889 domain-containing protein n=1 Tax=Brevundimonas sp. NIBR10 TaxID=3015997 RepID=UPI0022F14F43|nr:DUF2889 domain-containing protein [Brevundimonas sp. NIBR10]
MVTAELEDDWHRMVVTLTHRDGVVVDVASDMKRWPWTTCRGAIAQLSQTLEGAALDQLARQGERTHNCTHLHDLALFAAAHAAETSAIAYDVTVSDPVDGRRVAELVRNGVPMFSWRQENDLFIAPSDLAGLSLSQLGEWISTLDRDRREGARILRWAAIMAYGRAMEIPEGLSATAFPSGACFTFQPEQARDAIRRPDVPRDLSREGALPLADRAQSFDLPPGSDGIIAHQ